MYSVARHQQVARALAQVGVRLPRPQQQNLAMVCAALAMSPDCHLGTLALGLPLMARRDSLIEHLRRWLRRAPSWEAAYRPLAANLLAHWPCTELALVMDRTDLAPHCSILMLGAAYGKRLLPLTWRVLDMGGTGADCQIDLLRQVAPLIPADMRVIFFGDAEFRAVALQAYCRDQGWHWHVGLKCDIIIRTESGQEMALIDLPINSKSGPVYCQNVLLTATHAFGPVNILAHWSSKDKWPRFWATDLPADRHAWRRGRKRFWIEPSFRDWKSGGFDLGSSHLKDHQAIGALVLAISITTVWLVRLGLMVCTSSCRTLIDVPHKRDYSLFRLGRDYLKRADLLHWPVPIEFTLPQPAPDR